MVAWSSTVLGALVQRCFGAAQVLVVHSSVERCFGAAQVLVVHSSVEPESGRVVPLGSVVFSLGRPVLWVLLAYRVLALPRAAVESNRGCDS